MVAASQSILLSFIYLFYFISSSYTHPPYWKSPSFRVSVMNYPCTEADGGHSKPSALYTEPAWFTMAVKCWATHLFSVYEPAVRLYIRVGGRGEGWYTVYTKKLDCWRDSFLFSCSSSVCYCVTAITVSDFPEQSGPAGPVVNLNSLVTSSLIENGKRSGKAKPFKKNKINKIKIIVAIRTRSRSRPLLPSTCYVCWWMLFIIDMATFFFFSSSFSSADLSALLFYIGDIINIQIDIISFATDLIARVSGIVFVVFFKEGGILSFLLHY